MPYESLEYALSQDILTAQQEKHISWIDSLALAGCRTGGKCGLSSVKKAVSDLKGDKSPEELLGHIAAMSGLRENASPVTAKELAADFSWDRVSINDIIIDI